MPRIDVLARMWQREQQLLRGLGFVHRGLRFPGMQRESLRPIHQEDAPRQP